MFGKKSVDSIVKSVTKVVDQLEAFAEAEEVRRDDKKAKAEKLAADATKHDAECCRARKMSGNFRKLLEV